MSQLQEFGGTGTRFTPLRRSHRATVLAALLMVLTGAYLAHDLRSQGIYYDEYAQHRYGEAILEWYRSGFADTTFVELANLQLYGGAVELGLAAAVRVVAADPYLVRHALVACLALAALWGIFRLGSAIGSVWLGLIAMCLLATSPRFTGHALFNSKDIPLATFYVWTLVLAVRDVQRPVGTSLARVLPLGFMLGLLIGTRVGAGIIILALFVAYLMRWWQVGHDRTTLVFLAARLSAALLLAWGVMLSAWPWALQRPLTNPLLALMASSRFPWRHDQLFEGRFVSSLSLPLDYVPVWLARTLSEVTLLGLALALVFAVSRVRRGGEWRPELVAVVVAGVLPLVYVLATRAALYDETRHLLFLQPLIALAAAAGLIGTVSAVDRRSRRFAVAVAGLVALGLAMPVWDSARLAPYQYVYFNRVSGGLAAAAGSFELDYWGLSYREGVERLAALGLSADTRLASCSHPMSTYHFAQRDFEYVGSLTFGTRGEADYLLFTAPHDCGREPLSGERAPIVTRDGVPLLYLVKVSMPGGTSVENRPDHRPGRTAALQWNSDGR